MSVFRYYVSREPYTPSPPEGELVEVFADNITNAIDRIRREQTLPSDWPTVWVHVLVWSQGDLRGFASTQVR